MRIFISAGEASGDFYGAQLIRVLKRDIANVEIRGWGGDKMEDAGAQISRKLDALSFMGYTDVIANLPVIIQNIRLFKKEILNFRPDYIIYIDYPGFNLKMAKWAKSKAFTNLYFVPPATWAWKAGRIKALKKYFDAHFVLFPFEIDFYRSHKLEVQYTGHPVFEFIKTYKPTISDLTGTLNKSTKVIGLFPGSRKQEIRRSLHIMLKAVMEFPDYEILIAALPHIPKEVYNKIISTFEGGNSIRLMYNRNYDILSVSEVAVVCSGTISLEAAGLLVPQVVCYKTDFFSYQIARQYVRLKFISLVNILLNEKVVEELIQDKFTEHNLVSSISGLLKESNRVRQIDRYRDIHKIFSTAPGVVAISDYIKNLSSTMKNII